jgi:hypothetical protein
VALQKHRSAADIHHAMEHPEPQDAAAGSDSDGNGFMLALGAATVVMAAGLAYVVMFGSPLHKAAAAPRLSDAQQAYVQAVATQQAASYIESVATQQAADYVRAVATQQAEATASAGASAHAAPAKPAPATAAAPAAPPPPPPTAAAPQVSDANCLYRAQQLEEVAPILKGDPDFNAAVAEHAQLCADWIQRTGWVLQYDCGGPDYPVPHPGCALAEQ